MPGVKETKETERGTRLAVRHRSGPCGVALDKYVIRQC